MGIKNRCKKVKAKINKMVDIISLNAENSYLRKELEESKNKERPYIDKINALKSDIRVLKILNTKLEKKNIKFQEQINELEQTKSIFKE